MRVGPHHPPGYYGQPTTRRALNLTPGLEAPVAMDVALLRQLAKLYAAAPGRRDEAARFYHRALEAEPRHMDTLFDLAHMLETSRREESLALYRRALVVDPNYVHALKGLANLLKKEPSGREEALWRDRTRRGTRPL